MNQLQSQLSKDDIIKYQDVESLLKTLDIKRLNDCTNKKEHTRVSQKDI